MNAYALRQPDYLARGIGVRRSFAPGEAGQVCTLRDYRGADAFLPLIMTLVRANRLLAGTLDTVSAVAASDQCAGLEEKG